MDVATFLGPNSGYYLARFHFMNIQHTHTSWNWAAALFPAEWLFVPQNVQALCGGFSAAVSAVSAHFGSKLLIRAESVDGLWKYSRYLSGASFAGERTRLCSPLADGLHESCGIPGFRVAGCYGYLVKPFLS